MAKNVTSAGSESVREERLQEVILAYLKAVDAGLAPDRQAVLGQHPDLAADLAEFFAGEGWLMPRLAPPRFGRPDAAAANAVESRLQTDGAEAAKVETDQNQLSAVSGEATVTFASGQTASTGDGPSAEFSKPTFPGYEILAVLGRGGMGLVYKARQRSLKRIVALKVILAGAHANSEELARFRSEAEAVAQLQHPNIVQIYEVGEVSQTAFISLEFVEGGSLAAQLDGTPMPPRRAAQLVQPLAQAIHFAHQQGIIHRDLKPANILMAASTGRQLTSGKLAKPASTHNAAVPTAPPPAVPAAVNPALIVPKITDFGLAKRLDDDSGQTKSGTIIGSPSYMAPEQAAAQNSRVGPSTDIYGLGAILYELLTGRPPFKAATPWETINQVVNDEVVAPRLLDPKVNRDLETISLKCLQKDPRRRYASAQDLADDLRRYLEGRPISARPVSEVVRFWRLCRRHRGTARSLVVAFVSLLLLLVVIVIFNRRLRTELDQEEAVNHKLQMTLTKQVADRIDSDLRQLTRIPHLMATTLSVRADWRLDVLEAWMRQMLDKDVRLFGTCVALEPRQFDGKEEDFALYAFRGKNGVQTKMLLPPNYRPIYREWSWYAETRKHQRALWSEPFMDEGGGDIPMITYSVPIRREGKFVGVVTADLSVTYFDGMRQWLDELNLGKEGYAFVISSTGTFISHPDRSLQMPRKISETAVFHEGEALRTLTKRILNRETGSASAVDPSTGISSHFFFAPIASAQWSFIVVTKE